MTSFVGISSKEGPSPPATGPAVAGSTDTRSPRSARKEPLPAGVKPASRTGPAGIPQDLAHRRGVLPSPQARCQNFTRVTPCQDPCRPSAELRVAAQRTRTLTTRGRAARELRLPARALPGRGPPCSLSPQRSARPTPNTAGQPLHQAVKPSGVISHHGLDCSGDTRTLNYGKVQNCFTSAASC